MSLFLGEHQVKACERENVNAPPGITLWQVLEVDERCIPPACKVAASKIAWQWAECGRPAGKVVLSVFLHHALNGCVKAGCRYPKVVLLRLKQMQRGEWVPADYSLTAVVRRSGFQTVGQFLREGD